jgi:hypothetical protein
MSGVSKKETKIVRKRISKEVKNSETSEQVDTDSETSDVIDVFSNKTSSSSAKSTSSKSYSDDNIFCICLDKVYRVLGYREKRLAMKLLNGKYNFVENEDYKLRNSKTMITNECYRLLCLLSKTEQGDKYRRHIVNNFILDNGELGLETYKIDPMPEVNLQNIKKYDNRRLFFMINIRDTKYVYGITTDILMLLDLLNEQYNTIIINKLWLLPEKLEQMKIMTEINKELGDENKYPKYEKIKSCIDVDDIHELLIKMNDIFIKMNSI